MADPTGKFSSYPPYGTVGRGRDVTVTRPTDEGAKRLGKKKKKKDAAELLKKLHELQQEAMARRSFVPTQAETPQGPTTDINAWNKS